MINLQEYRKDKGFKNIILINIILLDKYDKI